MCFAGKKNQSSNVGDEDDGFVPLGLYFQLVKNKNTDVVKHAVATFASCIHTAQGTSFRWCILTFSVNSEGTLTSLASYFVSQGHTSFIKDLYRLFVCSVSEDIKFSIMKIFDVLSRGLL